MHDPSFCTLLETFIGSTYSSGGYGQGTALIAFGYLYCNGNEQSIFDCSRNVFSVISGTCTAHQYDVGITCDR